MGTALAVTQQQSNETATHSEDRCPRCSGLMVAEWCEDLSDYRAQRCVQCGEVIDPVILRNRGAQQRNGDRFLLPVRWTPQTFAASPAGADRPLATPRRGLSTR
jgi:hypothetical protein